MELPPRTRRILGQGVEVVGFPGTTSAYAENTVAMNPRHHGGGNYLRVCGEYLNELGLL